MTVHQICCYGDVTEMEIFIYQSIKVKRQQIVLRGFLKGSGSSCPLDLEMITNMAPCDCQEDWTGALAKLVNSFFPIIA